MYGNDRTQYIPWDVCVSREHELVTSTKKDHKVTVQSSGEVKLSSGNKVEPRDTSGHRAREVRSTSS